MSFKDSLRYLLLIGGLALSSCRTDPIGENQRRPVPPSEPVVPSPTKPPIVQGPSEDKELDAQELRVLQKLTPRTLDWRRFYADFGYQDFPKQIFARKGGQLTPEDREQEKTPPGTNDSAAHRYLMYVGQQVFQQALLARISQDQVYASNAVAIIERFVASDVRFINDPKNPNEVNDNRFLEMSWFVSLLARGAHILNSMPKEWQQTVAWSEKRAALNRWLGEGIDQNWLMAQAPEKSPLDLLAQAGLLTWVSPSDSRHGATNRSFASLEAQMRVAELRGGKLGRMRLLANAWQTKQGVELEHEGEIGQIFESFRGYLHYYVRRPLAPTGKEYSLRYDPQRDLKNSDPELLDAMPCRDPYKLGYRAECLLNKDAYRNDTYHPQMGFASILNILDIAARYGYRLSPDEEQELIKALRWTALNNLEAIVGKPARGIPIWELAFRFFSEEELGPYCKAERDADRAKDEYKRMALAWGFPRLALGF